MPMAPPRPCLTCGALACTTHVRPAWRSNYAPAPTRVRGRRLQVLRQALWLKDPHCAQCHRLLRLEDMIRDHIIPLAEGGLDLDDLNIQGLCQSCSDAKTEHESQRGRQGGYRSVARR